MPPFTSPPPADTEASYTSEQGFRICHNTIIGNYPATTDLLLARTASLEGTNDKLVYYWLFKDAAGKFLAIIPEKEILCILKLETVGPASADQPK